MEAEIVSIKIKLGERDIELTSNEARSLYLELGKLFEREKTQYIANQTYCRGLEKRPTPIWLDREGVYPKHWELFPTCKGSTETQLFINQPR